MLAIEIESNSVLLFAEIKSQGAPADRNFSSSHTQKPAKVDHCGARFSFFVKEHIADAPHILAFRAQHLFPQDPEEVVSREIVETGAVQCRIPRRLIGRSTRRRLRRDAQK